MIEAVAWAVLIGVAWLALGSAVGLLLGRAIHVADRHRHQELDPTTEREDRP